MSSANYTGPCMTQLTAIDGCVAADPGACGCFGQPFMDVFWQEVSTAYKTTMAFEIPGSEWFCPTANDNVCTQLETSGNCCCNTEVTDFITCSFESDWNPSFGAGDCPFNNCGAGGDGEDGSGGSSGGMMLYIIIGAVVAFLCCCCCGGGLYYRRRKRLAAEAAANNKTDSNISKGVSSSLSLSLTLSRSV